MRDRESPIALHSGYSSFRHVSGFAREGDTGLLSDGPKWEERIACVVVDVRVARGHRRLTRVHRAGPLLTVTYDGAVWIDKNCCNVSMMGTSTR